VETGADAGGHRRGRGSQSSVETGSEEGDHRRGRESQSSGLERTGSPCGGEGVWKESAPWAEAADGSDLRCGVGGGQ
jgi:hypothetical protein